MLMIEIFLIIEKSRVSILFIEFLVVCDSRNVKNKQTMLSFVTHKVFCNFEMLKNMYCDVTTVSCHFMCVKY